MPGFAEVFLSPLQGILSTLQSERHYKDRNFDDALLAMKTALLETQKHIELSGTKRDREKEFELAELWSVASIKAKRANIPFAKAISQKSRYWADQNIWEEDQILAKGIKFSDLEAQIDKLLSTS